MGLELLEQRSLFPRTVHAPSVFSHTLHICMFLFPFLFLSCKFRFKANIFVYLQEILIIKYSNKIKRKREITHFPNTYNYTPSKEKSQAIFATALFLNIIPASVRKYFQKILDLTAKKPRDFISSTTISLFRGTSSENFQVPSNSAIFLKK